MLIIMLAVAAQVAAQDLSLDDVAGIHLGDSETVATTRIHEFGKVKRKIDERGAVTLSTDEATATFCQGRVVHVARVIGRTVHDFAGFAEVFVKVHGPVESPMFFARDYERPPSDPRSEAKTAVTVMKLRWAKAPAYSLSYSQTNEDSEVFEALDADSPCDKPRSTTAPEAPERPR